MATNPPELHLMAGKIASGKSTFAASLSAACGGIVISEDRWLSALFSQEMRSLKDYVQYSRRLRDVVKPHVVDLLKCGATVVLDFPANTPENRAWLVSIGRDAGVRPTLHFLDVSDEVCLQRLHARNASGIHPFQVSDAQFQQVARHFVPPTEAEGFHVITHGPDQQPEQRSQ